MAPSLTELRRGISATVESLLKSRGLEVYAYDDVPSQAQSPCVITLLNPIESGKFNKSFRNGTKEWDFWVLIMVNMTNDSEGAQELLDSMITPEGDYSVPKILDDNDTFGLEDVQSIVTGVRGYGARRTIGSGTFVGAVVTVTVTTG